MSSNSRPPTAAYLSRLANEGHFKSEEPLQVPGKKAPLDQAETTKKKAHSSATKPQPGRPGDPRMNAAVQAKLEDPNLPLLDALALGGFVFEDLNKPGVKSSQVRDKDGVTVYQRRNQLLRRLRKERKRAQL